MEFCHQLTLIHFNFQANIYSTNLIYIKVHSLLVTGNNMDINNIFKCSKYRVMGVTMKLYLKADHPCTSKAGNGDDSLDILGNDNIYFHYMHKRFEVDKDGLRDTKHPITFES